MGWQVERAGIFQMDVAWLAGHHRPLAGLAVATAGQHPRPAALLEKKSAMARCRHAAAASGSQRQPAAGLGLDDRVRDDRDIGDFPSSVSIRLSRMGWLSPARWVMSAMALVRGRVGRWPGGGRSGFLHEAPGPWKRVVHRCAGVFGGVLVCAIAQRARRSVLQPGSALPQVFAASRFLY